MTAKSSRSQTSLLNKNWCLLISDDLGSRLDSIESGVDLLGHWPIDERSFSISFQGSPKTGEGRKALDNERKRPYRSGIIARYWFNIQRKSLIRPFLPSTLKSISYFRFRAFVSIEKITKISHVCFFFPQRTSYQNRKRGKDMNERSKFGIEWKLEKAKKYEKNPGTYLNC